jgi:hypothetical protein
MVLKHLLHVTGVRAPASALWSLLADVHYQTVKTLARAIDATSWGEGLGLKLVSCTLEYWIYEIFGCNVP